MAINSIHSQSNALPLDAFIKAADTGHELYLEVDGEKLQIRAQGKTPTGRAVAWVDPSTDTAAMFAGALKQSYGAGISSAVTRQLGLTEQPGKPLSSRVVSEAVRMADTAHQAIGGIDFATQIACSATAGSSLFLQACNDVGVEPSSVDAASRRLIDANMQQRFEQAALLKQSPVAPELAKSWLSDLLKQH